MSRICKTCKYRINIQNTEETGNALCSRPSSWFPIKIEDKCHYLPQKRRYTCSDCSHYGSDFGCIGVKPDEEPYWGEDNHLCVEFEEKYTNDFYGILSAWYALDKYDRMTIIGMLDDFEAQIKDLTEE